MHLVGWGPIITKSVPQFKCVAQHKNQCFFFNIKTMIPSSYQLSNSLKISQWIFQEKTNMSILKSEMPTCKFCQIRVPSIMLVEITILMEITEVVSWYLVLRTTSSYIQNIHLGFPFVKWIQFFLSKLTSNLFPLLL